MLLSDLYFILNSYKHSVFISCACIIKPVSILMFTKDRKTKLKVFHFAWKESTSSYIKALSLSITQIRKEKENIFGGNYHHT